MDYNIFMKRALQLAQKGLGHTYPNPMVGAVIVYNGKIIGEGYHRKAGEPHAEINAINSVKDKSLLKYSTMFVTLEPCSHYGKTPPCAQKIAQLKFKKVVVATIDTTEKVNGKGIKIMKDAGIEVITGVLEQEARQLNKRFFTYHEKKRPYIILKWAQSADGFIDIIRKNNKPQINWITGKYEKILVHKWRTEEQAILVGTNTIKNDNPQLTAREFYGKNPLRLFIDKKCQFVKNYNIADGSVKTICFTNLEKFFNQKNLQIVKFLPTENLIQKILSYLYDIQIQSLIVEGGKKTLESFLFENMWDEIRVFYGKKIFYDGLRAPSIPKQAKLTEQLELPNSTLRIFKK